MVSLFVWEVVCYVYIFAFDDVMTDKY